MPTFTRKYLKDKQGNYISTATLADMQYHSDGETTETKIQTIETTLGNGVLSTVSQNVVEGLNEVADEVIAARTDTTSTYDTLDARLDAMDVKIALASGGSGTIDLSAYQTKEDTNLQTNSKQVVGAINELNTELEDVILFEDYVGDTPVINDVTDRVTDLEVSFTELEAEVTNARVSAATTYASLDARLDDMDAAIAAASGVDMTAYTTKEFVEDNYLPLTGGKMTGNIESENGFTLSSQFTDGTTCNLIKSTSDNQIHVGHDSTRQLYLQGGTVTSVGNVRLWHDKKIQIINENGVPRDIAHLQHNHISLGDNNATIQIKGSLVSIDNSTVIPNQTASYGAYDADGNRVCLAKMSDNNDITIGDPTKVQLLNMVLCGNQIKAQGAILLPNGRGIAGYHTDGVSNRTIGFVNDTNEVLLSDVAATTKIRGSRVYTPNLTIDANTSPGTTDAKLRFLKTDGTEASVYIESTNNRLTIENATLNVATNNIMLGSNSASYYVTLTNGSAVAALNSNTSDQICLGNSSCSTVINSIGNTGVMNGTWTTSYDGYGNLGNEYVRWGVVFAKNGIIQTSDMRQKTDIRDIDDNIFFNLVKNSGVHSYVLNYNDMPDDITQETAPIEQVHVGIIAQEVAQNEGWEYILVTKENEDGDVEYSVNNYNLTSAIMAALKIEISKREELQTELDLVKEENEQLKERLDAIEQALGL